MMIKFIAIFCILSFLSVQSCDNPQKGKGMTSEHREVIFPDSLETFFDSPNNPDSNGRTIVFNVNGSCGVCFDKINLLDSIISNSKLTLPVDIIVNSGDNYELFKFAYRNIIKNRSNFSFSLDRDGRFLMMNNLQDSLVLIKNNKEIEMVYPFNSEQDAIEFVEFAGDNR